MDGGVHTSRVKSCFEIKQDLFSLPYKYRLFQAAKEGPLFPLESVGRISLSPQLPLYQQLSSPLIQK